VLPALVLTLDCLCLTWNRITHFVIFVRACVETNQRNRTRPFVMMVPSSTFYAAPNPNMGSYTNTYPMMPPQARMGPPQGAVLNEKLPEVQAQNTHSSLAGYYAPLAMMATIAEETPRRENAGEGSSRAP
jgi:hypothetical protein